MGIKKLKSVRVSARAKFRTAPIHSLMAEKHGRGMNRSQNND